MRAVVRLRKALTAGSISSIVPQDLEGSVQRSMTHGELPTDDDTEEDRTDERTDERPRTAAPMCKAMYRTANGERRGTPIAFGSSGATIVDHETGEAHRVDHGHYLEPATPEDRPGWRKTAAEHLELGPRSSHAIHAIGALACDAGCEAPHALTRADVKVSGHKVSFGAGAHVEDPHVASSVRWLLDRDGPDSDLWSWEESGKRQRLTESSLAAYRARIGALPPPTRAAPEPRRTSTAAGPRPRAVARVATTAPMRKAVDAETGELLGQNLMELTRWSVKGYTARLLAKNGVPVLTMMGKGLPMPFHLLVRDEADAHRQAQTCASEFDAGRTPMSGTFRRLVGEG